MRTLVAVAMLATLMAVPPTIAHDLVLGEHKGRDVATNSPDLKILTDVRIFVPRNWDDLGKGGEAEFLHQCYLAAWKASSRFHKRFCLRDLRESYDSILVIGHAIVVDSMEDTWLLTQPISFMCNMDSAGNFHLFGMRDDGWRYPKDWATLNDCQKF